MLINEKKVMIATPAYEMKMFSAYLDTLLTSLKLLDGIGVKYVTYFLPGDSYVHRARNTIVSDFYKSDCTDLVFIDSDLTWRPKDLVMLIANDAEVVGGAYPCKNQWDDWGVRIFTDENGIPDVDPQTGLIRAQMVPTGFMKITRRAIDRMIETYPDLWYWAKVEVGEPKKQFAFFNHLPVEESHIFTGEDGSFVHRYNAAGGDLWLMPDATFEHYGIKEWRGNYHEYLLACPGGSKSPESDNPLVSVVIVSYGNYEFIGECIKSVLNQTYRNIEIIVMDNNEDERIQQAIEHFPVRIIKTANEGVSAARNKGIATASGIWICCLDGDDKIHPSYIKSCIQNSKGFDIVSSWMQQFGGGDKVFSTAINPEHKDFLTANRIHCASLFKKEVWSSIGGYDEGLGGVPYTGYEDYDLWLRATDDGYRVNVVQQALFYWRKHDGQITSIMNHEEMCRKVLTKNGVKQETQCALVN